MPAVPRFCGPPFLSLAACSYPRRLPASLTPGGRALLNRTQVWELLVCDDTGALRHAEYFANNKVNSSNLKVALEALFASLGGVRPAKVRFFRTQMNTIIGRALKDLNIKPVPSLKCAELIAWLDDRYDTVYTQHPGFQPDVAPLMGQEAGPVEELPEELRGSQWAFVELELGELIEEARSVREGGLFGDALDVAAFAEEMGLPLNTPVPGVVALSQRAAAVAAWTSGIEVVALQADDTRASLVMEANVSTRFRYATWPRNDAAADDEAREWTQAKAKAGGLHFLALQADADEDVVGFWALRDIKLPRA